MFFLRMSKKNANFAPKIEIIMHRNTEIERKFLVKNDRFKQHAIHSQHIEQGYLCKEPAKTIRIRISGEKAYITIKSSQLREGLAKFEWEKEININDAQELMQLCLPGVICKTRYIIPANKTHDTQNYWEVDVFEGRLQGLVLAEIELENEQETFDKPDWIGEEVTGQTQYYNANM